MKNFFFFLFLCCSLSVCAQWKLCRGDAVAEKSLSRVTGEGVFRKNFPVIPGRNYMFSAEVISPHEVFFTFSPVSGDVKKIAYTTPGKIQKIAGLVCSSEGNFLTAEMHQTLKKGVSAPTYIRNIQFSEFDPLKCSFSVKSVETVTLLDKNAFLILPADPLLKKRLLPLAVKISRKLGGIPVIDDSQACLKDAPALKKEYADCNLIIVGNLNNNRAFWPAYTRTLAGADAFYPGGKGYELRTAVNVLSNGKNHIIIGGSSHEGLLRGMERFLSLCSSRQKMLLEVRTDGDCARRIKEDIADWKKNFPGGKGKFPGSSPGYDAVRRWYHHALMYYWTGDDFYRKMAQQFIKPLIRQKAYTHHYIMEWLFLAWEVSRNTDLYTPAEKSAMEQLLLANYTELQKGIDMKWTRPLVPPYRHLRINSRHVTAPLWCQLMASDYLYRNFSFPAPMADLVRFTRKEAMDAASHIASERSRPDVDFETGDNYAELARAVFRFAFRFDRFGIFQNGQARKWGNFQFFSNTERDNVVFSRFQEFALIAAVLGSCYRDPEYKFYEVNAPGGKWGRGMFYDRYPNGINAFNNDLVPALPRKDLKLHLMSFSPYDRIFNPHLNGVLKKYPALEKMTPLISAVMRNGAKSDFTVFGMTGSTGFFKGICGEITHLSFHRRNFLNNAWTSVYNHNSGLPLEKNTLHITRKGQDLNGGNSAPQTGFLNWSFDLGGRQAFSCRFVDANGTCWSRSAVMLTPGQILVHDSVTAEKSDQYNIAVVWRPGGKTILPNGPSTLLTSHGKHVFSIDMSGKGFKLKTNTASWLNNESEKLLSLFAFDGKLEKGQTVTASSLLQVNSKSSVHDCGNGRILISENGRITTELRITEKGFVEISRQFLAASNCREVTVGTQKIKFAEKDTDLFWGLQNGNCYRSKAGFRKAPADEIRKVRAICHAYLDSLKIPAVPQRQPGKVDSGKKGAFKLLWKNNILKTPEVWSSPGKGVDFFDAGRVAELAYCRSLGLEEKLPPFMEYSADGKNFKRIELKDPVWQEGVWTHNYGNIALRKKGFQELYLPQKIRGRFFRFPGKYKLQLHFSDRQKPLRAPRILAVEPFILVAPEVVKIYPRAYNYDNALWGALDHSGKTLFVKKQQLAPHDISIVDFPANGSVAVANPDGRLRFYDRSGKELMMIDTIEKLKDFHKKYGRSNTRHPAGGFASTYSLGTWQTPAALVAGRYGQMSFYGPEGEKTGVRGGGTYCISAMLPKGVDFDGDGHDEILAMSCSYLIHCTGKFQTSPPAPGTTWPQVYDRIQHRLPVWWSIGYGVWGPKIFAFKTLPSGGKVRYAAGISRIFMFIYDGAAKKYAWQCKFPTPVAAADIKAVTGERWLAVTAGDDSVVTVYEWKVPGAAPQILARCTPDDEIRAVAVSEKGRIFAAGSKGIYEMTQRGAVLVLDGNFTDVKCRNDELLCAEINGTVSAWKE